MLDRSAGFLVVTLAVLVGACGATDSRLAELEAENEELRRRLDELGPPTTATGTASTSITGYDIVVTRIVDGDTLRLRIDGSEEPVRLIGINAPEYGECLYQEASDRLAQLVRAGDLRLKNDVSNRDQHERLLRYVYAGDVFVNEELVRDGMALAVRYQPDVALADELEAAQTEAQEAAVGLWAPDACGEESGFVDDANMITIGHIRYDAAGNDNDNLNDEWVEFTNPSTTALDLTGWMVRDESSVHRYRFPSGFVLEGGSTVRLHTGCGTDSDTALYWCNTGSAVWNNSGDTVFVLDPDGNVVVSESYPGR